jgi:hypothetical protein
MAFPPHGYARATLDIDILIEPTRENAERTLRALEHFGYDVSETNADEMLTKKLLFRGYAVAADIHPEVTGVTFEEVWTNKVVSDIQGVEAYFADLDDLLKMKTAANRPKDQEDIRVLRRLKERRDQEKRREDDRHDIR